MKNLKIKLRNFTSQVIILTGILILCFSEGIQAQRYYKIIDFNFPVEVNGITKKRGDFIKYTDCIKWGNRAFDEITVADKKNKYTITKKGWQKIEAKCIGDYIISCKTLKTKGLSTNVIGNSTVSIKDIALLYVDTINCDIIDDTHFSTPQIPLSKCDSIIMINHVNRYVIVYKNGLYGFFDTIKSENITPIEYSWVSTGNSKGHGDESYSLFIVEYHDRDGLLVVSQKTNKYILVLLPNKKEEEELL